MRLAVPILVALALSASTLASTEAAAQAVAPGGTTATLAAAAVPAHTMKVGGDGVSIYPSPSPDVYHYGIRTTAATGGTVTISASTSDPTGRVTIGTGSAQLGTASATLTGLTSGDKVTVTYDDADGVRVDSLIYLPSDFPQLVATTSGTPQRGDVFINVGGYATAVDQNAVPVFLTQNTGGADFKKQPNGNYSTSEYVGGPAGYQIAEFDKSFHRIGTHSARPPVVNTDAHDSILEPNGNQVTISYEPNVSDPNQWDAVIQEADPAGNVTFTWNSKDHFTPADAYATGPPPTVDYMHINSIQITADGNFLASFRNLSAVVKIARSDGHVIWQLGGKHNDFTFVDDPLNGPCAQHAAYELPNGHLLLFDDGAQYDARLGDQTGDFCPNPASPFPYTANRVARAHSRGAEYALDEVGHTATMVWDYDRSDIYTAFAGSAQRLSNGDTLVDWAFNGNAGSSIPLATEVDAARNIVWEITSPSGAFSYRAVKFASNDDRAPEVSVASPQEGATYPVGASVVADFGCTDGGGSLLRTCRGSVRHGNLVDTSTPGSHTITVTGTDHGGNSTVVERHYTVADVRPDALIRRGGAHPWVGDNRFDHKQHVNVSLRRGRSAVIWLRLQNDGSSAQSFRLAGARKGKSVGVRYFLGRRNVTASVTSGGFTTATLQPTASIRIKVVVSRRPGARPGTSRTLPSPCRRSSWGRWTG